MRKWYVSLTVVGIGGLGAFLLSDTGKNLLHSLVRYVRKNTEALLELNEAAEAEMQRIQAALSELADSLQPHREIGH